MIRLMTERKRFVSVVLVFLIVPVIIVTAGCIAPAIPGGTGQIEGVATIGPLCPVEPCHISDEQRAGAYAARHLVITAEGLSSQEYTVPFSPDGHYTVALPEGYYRVDIAKNGIDRSPDLPKTVAIKQGETVTLNLSIDTGIR
jgi:hypothetical protein